jgi:hypothetical protein
VAALANDTALFIYEVDQVAGFHVLGQGPITYNPEAVLRTWLTMSGPQPVSLDTIGGTTYDLQTCGPARPMIYDAPGYGVHALWSYSSDTSRSFLDLNARCNFYDFGLGAWNWTDPDFMQSGVNVFPYRAGLGCLDVDPATGVAVISGCTPPPLPHVAVEEGPRPQATSPKPTATVVRGSLLLQEHSTQNTGRRAELLDITGRRVLDLHPGANDVGRLSPGVYFVRAVSRKLSAASCQKVVLIR